MSKYNCEHGKRKRFCIDCGGSGLCKHGQQKCKECHKHLLCLHNKYKHSCRDCKGSSFCEHDKQKQICKECGGVSICEHGKQRYRCKDCGGSSICEHGISISQCKECGGSSICEHNIRKTYCLECGGGARCKHNKIRSCCKECGGSAFCEHGKYKQGCKECGGSQFCEHNKVKPYCKICDGKYLCKNEWCETTGNKNKYDGYCFTCFFYMFPDKPNVRNYKTKEIDVVGRIKQTFTDVTWVADKKVQDGCSRRRPDLLLDMGTHIIIVEIDENKHTDYDCSCEHKRLMELSQDLHHRPIVFIRFNPDDYTNQDGVLIKSCWKLNKLGVMQLMKTKQKEWEERINTLKQQIQYWIDNPTNKTIEIIELFY
jgi:hypothetical protein